MSTKLQKKLSQVETLLNEVAEMALLSGIDAPKLKKVLADECKRSPDAKRAMTNVHRFISSGFTVSLLQDFLSYRPLLNTAVTIFSQSQYLSDILVRSPELFHWLTSTNVLNESFDRDYYIREALETISFYERREKKLDGLKRFHRKNFLRLGAMEILNIGTLEQRLRELSWLADSALEAAITIGFESLIQERQLNFSNSLAVIGLGKLGGEELNYSSDIDLMFVYELADSAEPETQQNFYSRLAEFVVKTMTESTNEGHLYRVDMRLRPEGTVGAIVLPLQSYFAYYEHRGELWEHQMLTKGRTVAGNATVGNRFLETVGQFIYPKSMQVSPLEEIATIKKKIEEKTKDTNIKLGSGGIRDIEFICQALLLLHGGKHSELRETNTLFLMSKLYEANLFSQKEYRTLEKAYRTFRSIEHRLQLLHGFQTHTLPEGEEYALLAARLNYLNASTMRTEIETLRTRVRKIYNSVFLDQKSASKKKGKQSRSEITPDDLHCEHPKECQRWIESIRTFLSVGEDEGIFGDLVKAIKKRNAPDRTIKNVARLLEPAATRRTIQIAMRSPRLRDVFTKLAATSDHMIDFLISEPLLIETMINQQEEMNDAQRSWEFFLPENRLRYKKYNEYKYTLQFLIGNIDIDEMTERLSVLAEEHVKLQLGYLTGASGSKTTGVPFCVVAMGKLGGQEMTIRSDLDLMFIFEDDKKRKNFLLTEKIITSLIDSMDEEGEKIYEIDLRLRPEGKSSPLPVELRSYKNYMETRASTWEVQSLLKARPIWGNPNIMKEFESIKKEAFVRYQKDSHAVSAIMEMRQRIEKERGGKGTNMLEIKCSPGGLIDLEFSIQLLQLKFIQSLAKLHETNSLRVLRILEDEGMFSKNLLKRSRENLLFFRALETYIRLNSASGSSIAFNNSSLVQCLRGILGEKNAEAVKKSVINKMKENRSIYNKVCEYAQR
jgi:glutamate-ammonia-ligase adenylyltransferase